MKTGQSWDTHYHRERSRLAYPDENLCRLLKKAAPPSRASVAMDMGCGSGRHIPLLKDIGYESIIGTDISLPALKIAGEFDPDLLLQCANERLPLKKGSLDLIVAWGSLHYADKTGISPMLDEICRVLKKGGLLLATLRSSRDTYLRSGQHLGDNVWITDLPDISGATVSFYDEHEVNRLLTAFGVHAIGLSERSLMGHTDKIISHWIISATK